MADIHATGTAPAASEENRTMVLVVFGLYLFAALSCGIAGIAGVIVAYVKRHDAIGSMWESHFDNQISAFWVWFALAVAGLVLIPALGIGFLVILFAFGWFLYRAIKGLVRALETKAYG
jgi:uncharacterized membrane protein